MFFKWLKFQTLSVRIDFIYSLQHMYNNHDTEKTRFHSKSCIPDKVTQCLYCDKIIKLIL